MKLPDVISALEDDKHSELLLITSEAAAILEILPLEMKRRMLQCGSKIEKLECVVNDILAWV